MAQFEDPVSTGRTNGPQEIASGRRRFLTIVLGTISGAIAGILRIPLAGFFALPAL